MLSVYQYFQYFDLVKISFYCLILKLQKKKKFSMYSAIEQLSRYKCLLSQKLRQVGYLNAHSEFVFLHWMTSLPPVFQLCV